MLLDISEICDSTKNAFLDTFVEEDNLAKRKKPHALTNESMGLRLGEDLNQPEGEVVCSVRIRL